MKTHEKDTRTAVDPEKEDPTIPGTERVKMTEEDRQEKIKLIKMLKALDNPIRRSIVEFILNQESSQFNKKDE